METTLQPRLLEKVIKISSIGSLVPAALQVIESTGRERGCLLRVESDLFPSPRANEPLAASRGHPYSAMRVTGSSQLISCTTCCTCTQGLVGRRISPGWSSASMRLDKPPWAALHDFCIASPLVTLYIHTTGSAGPCGGRPHEERTQDDCCNPG